VALINDAVAEHRGEAEQSDDITILVLSFAGRPRTDEAPVFRLTGPATVEGIATVLDGFGSFAEEQALPDAVRQMVMLALDDLLNNIISYAYDDRARSEMDVVASAEADRLVITISDSGRPFNPLGMNAPDVQASLQEREIGGLGIHLVRNVMDEVDYSRRAGSNVVTVTKHFEPEQSRADADMEGQDGP
jgi:sigma-B regulation protein RsbU (phosphoserine phosphatase)